MARPVPEARSKLRGGVWRRVVRDVRSARSRLSALRRRSYAELDDEFASSLDDTGDDPELTRKKSDSRAILRDCLAQLSSAHREVIDLIYYHGKSIEDIAHTMGTPLNTVKRAPFTPASGSPNSWRRRASNGPGCDRRHQDKS